MLTYGKVNDDNNIYDIFCWNAGVNYEVVLSNNNTVVSAYKTDGFDEYMFINGLARQIATFIIGVGKKKVAGKNKVDTMCKLGIAQEYSLNISKTTCTMTKYRDDIVGLYASNDNFCIDLVLYGSSNVLPSIKYIKLTKLKQFNDEEQSDTIPTRSLEEISLEKDTTWLANKKYYIVNDADVAEKIFKFLENYGGVVAFDTETTGLKINCFGKVNSKYESMLSTYNDKIQQDNAEKLAKGEVTQADIEAMKIKADSLIGIILCWKPNESYYFPCGNRLFENLYSNRENKTTQAVMEYIRRNRKVADPDSKKEISRYIEKTSNKELRNDVILMERVRDILEHKHIVTHHGTFDWMVCMLFDVLLNIKDDTMIMHQLMYKFKDTSRQSGAPSDLKSLTKKEFEVDQLDLGDFFCGYSENDTGIIRGASKKKKKSAKIDFSYMTYENAKAYGPADGDFTLQLDLKYKPDMLQNYPEIEYLYSVEIVVSMALGYMQFYGHKIDESKIAQAEEDAINKRNELEVKIRELAGLGEKDEFNLGSPAQVAELFFNKLGIPFSGDKPSVKKNVLKQYLDLKDADGNQKYPIVNAYSDWKKQDTLVTKFFGKLPDFMFPGGFIFSSYRQIETATGRMSCNRPNFQQYNKAVCAMVVPRENCVMFDADYSQIEYRVLTALAKEKHLMEMFNDPDTDYHTLMASIMYGVEYASVTPKMRKDAKSFNFGIPYGMGFGSLAILLSGANTPEYREEAMQKYELYFKDQPNVRQFFDNVKELATINKYTKTKFNRRRYYRFEDKDGNYSNQVKARSLRQAGNAVIQGSAADIFKIAMARIFLYIKNNDLFGKIHITGMIHDEGLYEINTHLINAKAAMRDITNCMQYHIDGFPPLFVGGGFGMAWKLAKGGSAEIHPTLCNQIADSAKDLPILATEPQEPKDVVAMFDKLNLQFRINKISEYLTETSNFHRPIHPVIGKLLNSFFDYGLPEDEPDRLMKIIPKFITEYKLGIDPESFKIEAPKEEDIDEEEDDVEYEDDDIEEKDAEADENDVGYSEFALVDESDKAYGVDLHELIDTFGFLVSYNLGVCGIDMRGMSYSKVEAVSNFLEEHKAKEDTDMRECLEVVLLKDGNVVTHTGYYITGVSGSEVAKLVKKNTVRVHSEGTIEDRCAG